jgi:hypothetical protein
LCLLGNREEKGTTLAFLKRGLKVWRVSVMRMRRVGSDVGTTRRREEKVERKADSEG